MQFKIGVVGIISGLVVVKITKTYNQQSDTLLAKLKQFVS